jgi:hypothetical protein
VSQISGKQATLENLIQAYKDVEPTAFDEAMAYFEGYWAEIETFLEHETIAVQQRRKIHKNLVDQLDDFDALTALEAFFPNIFRRSFFMALFSLAEARLNEICQSLEERRKLPLSLEKIKAKDQSILRAKKYLETVAGIKFPADTELDRLWKRLIDYKKIRNRITHDYLGFEDSFAKGFCEEVMTTIRTFYKQLDKVLGF